LFADVVDSTALGERMDPEDWSGAMRAVLALMSERVERYGGTVARLMGDGLLAIFGVPTAHEDDPVRAVQAGLEMIESVGQATPRLRGEFGVDLGEALQIRVGINTGLAIVEGFGESSTAADALGDAVNVAARMQSAARPDSVLITGETWRYAAPIFRATSLGAVAVKGRSEAVDAWEIVDRHDQPGTGRGIAGLDSPMVGRDDQLEQLRSLVPAVRSGRGGAAVMVGEPGVGKSRLLAEFRSLADTAELRWVEARCASYGENIPYGLLGELVSVCLGVPAGSPEERHAALRERTRTLFGEASEEPYASVGHLLSLPLPADVAEALGPLSPHALQLRYLSAAQMALRELGSQGPAVVVLEDVHWADASSVDVVADLLPIAHELPILFLVTSRPERGSVGWHLVERSRETFGDALAELRLVALDAAESRLLIGNLLEIDSLPERLRVSIMERAEGNPFFVEELIRMLIERGWVVRKGERWVGSGTVAEAEVPDTIRGLLLARIDRLPNAARRTIRVGAVIGRDVPVRLLEEVTGDPAGTARALGLAEAAGLVRFASPDPEPVYRFRHVLIQEAAYDSLLKTDRRRLHRQVGEALETRAGDRRDEIAAVLGLHFDRAGDVDRAIHYLQLAGRQAMRRQALAEARDLFDRAAARLDDAPESVEYEHKRVEVGIDRVAARIGFGSLEEDLVILTDAKARAERLDDERLIGLVFAREAGTRAMRNPFGDSALKGEAVTRAMEIGTRLDDPEILAFPRALYGLMLIWQGRLREAIPVLEEAVALLERFGAAEASFYAGQLATAHAELGEFEVAERMVARASELASISGDPTARADAQVFKAMLLLHQGRYDEAAEAATAAAGVAQQIGEVLCQSVASWLAGEAHLASGRAAPAIEWLGQARDLAMSCGASAIGEVAQVGLQAARAIGGGGKAALRGIEPLLARIRASGSPLNEVRVLMLRAEINASLPEGDRDQARADADAAITILRRVEAPPYLERAERLRASLV
ncbi:MAG TPA: adenylate/guanylate cyclase domain-containing protein, partial [Candidatus Limnocylindrales bacterium]|nr:adenylate/guanylate cyclase domain-containing protein [Candidatus Limnocylindrales bacterium]